MNHFAFIVGALAAAGAACSSVGSGGSGSSSSSSNSSTTTSSPAPSSSTATSSSSTASSSTTGTAGAGASGLPTPPGGGGLAKPSGAPGGLSVLNWAGFTAATSWTFDDSQPSQIAHYAEIEAAGLPSTFYISSGLSSESGYQTTWTQAVNDGHEIGNHTVHHCKASLTGCSFGTVADTDSVAAELDQCSTYITSNTPQRDVWTGASPFGDTGYDSAAASRFLVYRGVGNGTIGAGANDKTDPTNLPIHLAATGETADMFNAVIDSTRSSGQWLIILVHTITPTNDNWYNPVAVTDVTASMAHQKSLGDVWGDTVANIGAYWRAQKLLAAATPTTSGNTSTYSWTLPDHFPPNKYLRVTVTGGTLSQSGAPLAWNDHGYYEISLDAGSLTIGP